MTGGWGVALKIPHCTKCTGCGKEQVRSTKDLHGRVPAAMVGINDGAGFPHSG